MFDTLDRPKPANEKDLKARAAVILIPLISVIGIVYLLIEHSVK